MISQNGSKQIQVLGYGTEKADKLFVDEKLAENATNGAEKDKSIYALERALIDSKASFPNLDKSKLQELINTNQTITVSFWGDSITEGADLVDLNDSYAKLAQDTFKKLLPTHTLVFNNFGLGSRTINRALDETYVAVNPEITWQTEFWRPWATVGKSWRAHVRDSNPDILFFAFGMNDTGISSLPEKAEADNLQLLLDYIATWSKQPIVILIPTILPTTDTKLTSQSQIATKAISRATREFAKNKGVLCADVGRVFQIVRDGKDDVLREGYLEENLEGLTDTSKWSGETSSFSGGATITANTTTARKKITRINKTAYDFYLTFTLKTPSAQGSYAEGGFILFYRDKYQLQIAPNPTVDSNLYVNLYYDGTSLANATISGKGISSNSAFEIRVNGSKHEVYIDNVLRLSVTNYHSLREGNWGLDVFRSNESLQLVNFKFRYKEVAQHSPLYTEEEILGLPNSNQDGNAINHMTAKGYKVAYKPILDEVIKHVVTAPVSKNQLASKLVNPAGGNTLNIGDDSNLLNLYTTVASTIDTISNAREGRVIEIFCTHSTANTIIFNNSGNMKLGAGTTSITVSNGDYLRFVYFNTKWQLTDFKDM